MTDAKKIINQQGFYIAKGVIPQGAIDLIVGDIHSAARLQLGYLGIDGEPKTTQETLLSDLKKLYTVDSQRYLATLRLCAKLMSVYQLYLSPKLVELVAGIGIELPLFQTQPVLHLMSEQLRIKEGYFGIGAHQDWPSLQSGLDTLTCWIPMFDVRRRQFTLEVIPKSHRNGLVEAKQEEHIHEVDPQVYRDTPFQPIELNAGDALLFSTFLIHKTEREGDPSAFRLALSMRYENGRDANFVKRSFPSAQRRVVDRFLRESDVPSSEDVMAVYRDN